MPDLSPFNLTLTGTRSPNPDPDRFNLQIKILRNDRVLVYDGPFSMGAAHAPSRKATKAPSGYLTDRSIWDPRTKTTRPLTSSERLARYREDATAAELEIGYPVEMKGWGQYIRFQRKPKSELILPSLEDVMHCILLDADVLNYATFEDWAPDLGYDPDSRKAYEIYQACLKIGLRLNQAFSATELATLRTLFEDY